MNHLTDEQISKLLRGGHDVRKMYAAYKAAMEHKGQPTVILAKTVKGYGLGEAGEGKNISHQQKKMNEKELREFRERFNIPISDDVIADMPFFRPPPDSAETKYLLERRKALGGFVPARIVKPVTLDVPKLDYFAEFLKGSATRKFPPRWRSCGLLTTLLRHKSHRQKSSCRSFPTRRARSAWTRCSARFGIYSPKGQLYEPVDNKIAARIITKPRTARFSKKASAKPARCRRSSPPARATPRTACR